MRREPLPIDNLLPAVAAAVRDRGLLLLLAEPGSGKTTRAPAALLDLDLGGDIVVLEPRRLAARAAAARVAAELGAEVGGLVGYQVRGDRRVSRATRLSFVTEGVLVRRLVQDPFLDGTAVVVLDEFHERHLEGDLALAMLREVRDTVRPDLRLVVMSATLDLAPLRAFLPGAVELTGTGRVFPVRVEHEPRRDDGPLEERVRAAVERALADTPGDVLVFLPGIGEIARCEAALQNLQRRTGATVLPLHGRMAPADQDAAIRPQAARKVVLSTNVAESSLTIPGITAVVDSGLCRELRFDRGRGVDVLALARISTASAVQRTGRAGRTAPGVCYRLWTAGEERAMPARTTPDIERVDLCGPALQVRAFAGRDPREFAWFEPPPPTALAAGDALLRELDAVDDGGRLTATGQGLLQLPLHPRLGAAVLAGRTGGVGAAAATAAVLLADVDQFGRGDGASVVHAAAVLLAAEARGLPAHLVREAGVHPGEVRQLLRTRDRIVRIADDAVVAPGRRRARGEDVDIDDADFERAVASSLLAGFPDRVAARVGDGREAVMVGGRGLLLPPAADGNELVLALRLHESGRQQRSLVTAFAPLDQAWLDDLGALDSASDAELDEAQGRVVGARTLRYRDLVLRRARGGEVPPGRAAELLRPLLLRDPARWLGDQRATAAFVGRVAFLRARMPELDLPELDAAAVAGAAIEHLGRGLDLRAVRDADLSPLLAGRLLPVQLQALQRHAPERVRLPSGRSIAIDYQAPAGPTVRARMQELFGLPSVAALAGGRVPLVLELLAPNHRPVQVTTDLASFWDNVYPTVRRELQRRYPRHSWPEDPRTAAAEARPQRRRPS